MTSLAIVLILISAVCHATWNLLAKRANGGITFVWLYDLLALLFYGPVLLVFFLLVHLQFTLPQVLFILGSSILQLGYFILLQRAYRIGDLSVVYPVARGTGPALAVVFAVLIFKEHPSLVAIIGTILIVLGVFIIASGKSVLQQRNAKVALLYGVAIGVIIASYTLWDKETVSVLLVPPLVLNYGTTLLRMVGVLPYALTHWSEVQMHWREHRWEAIGIALLNPLAYVLVLTALVFTPVSSIAPAREVSVLIGIIMGARLLSEGDVKRRLIAATMIVLGVIALAL